MGNQVSISRFSAQYLFPALLAIVLMLVLSAVFTVGDYNDTPGLETDWISMKNGKIVNRDWFSVEVSGINENTTRKYNIPSATKGVVIVEIEGARDVKNKLQEGDVICGINGRRISNVRDFRKASRIFNPAEGLLLDINRNGYPMYIPISGTGYTSNSQSIQYQNPQPFELLEIAPFLEKGINAGGMHMQNGVIGNAIENWINDNFSDAYYACLTCGTLVPHDYRTKNKNIACPNCGCKMILK